MKKENIVMVSIIIVIIAITAGVVGFKFAKNVQAPTEKATNVQPSGQNKPVTADLVNQTNVRVAKAGYKIVEVKNSEVPFSFEVPEKWMTETRNSGEKQLSVEKMREFLGTQYTYSDPDSKKTESANAYYKGNGGINSDDVKTLNPKEIQQAFKDSNFPNISVSSEDVIWYGEFNGFQIDFFIKDGLSSELVNKIKKEAADVCKKEGNDYFGCGSQFPVWENVLVDSKNTDIQIQPAIKGEIVGGKPNPAGKTYYIQIPNSNKTLVIEKQARGDAQFEKDFDNLIQTLKIGEKNSANNSGWQKFTDAKNGFEFSYPSEFGIVSDENSPVPVMLDKVFLSGQSSYVFQVNTWVADDKNAPDFFKIKNNTDVSDWVINKQGKKYEKENGKYFSNKIGSKFNVDGLETLHLVSRQQQGGFSDDFYFIKNGNLYVLEIISELNMIEDLKLEDSSQWYVKLLSSFSFTK